MSEGTGEFYDRLWREEADGENRKRWAFQQALVERALARVGPAPGVVLEIGPGAGSESARLIAAGARLVAADVAVSALLRTREATSGAARLVRAAAEALPLRDASVDAVFAQTVLMHLDLDRALGELGRVLRPGGRVVILEPLPHHPLVLLYRRFLSPYRATAPRYVTVADVARASPRLRLVAHELHYLLAPAVLALPDALGRPLRPVLAALDRVLLGLPGVRRLAWMALIELRAEAKTA